MNAVLNLRVHADAQENMQDGVVREHCTEV